MAREIAGKDQSRGGGERRPWALEQRIVVAASKAWGFIMLVSFIWLLWVFFFFFWSGKRKALGLIQRVKTIPINLCVVGSRTHLSDVEGFDRSEETHLHRS